MADYVKLPEVARRLGVSEKTARRMVKAGKLPAVFIGNAYRVNEEDLAEYLKSARVEPGKARRRSPYEPSLNDVLAEERRDAIAERATRYLHAWTTYLNGLVDQWARDTKDLVSPGDWDAWCSARDGEVGKLAESLEELPDFGEVAADGDEEELDQRRRLSAAYSRMGRFLQAAVEKAEDEASVTHIHNFLARRAS